MKSIVLSALLTALASGAAAQESKSPAECATEAGDRTGADKEQFMVHCLLSHLPAAALREPTAEDVDGRHPFFVKYLSHEVNSAGGVELSAGFVNPGHTSAIKYVTLGVRMFNAVGDRVFSRVGGSDYGIIKFTGPLSAGEGVRDAEWNPLWYNATAACVRIEHVQVDFMNGKKQTFQGSSVRNALSNRIRNDCRAQVK